MARRTFISFHYDSDKWRVAKVRNIGVIESNKAVSDNDWETVKRGGDKAIKKWIADQLKNRTCTIVLVGENTADRKWINYEIKESWNAGMGVVGIRIHRLEDNDGKQSKKGKNPFDRFVIGGEKPYTKLYDEDSFFSFLWLSFFGKNLSSIVKLYDPPQTTSKGVYAQIEKNMSDWVEEAIQIRKSN
jgi:hypothetical protein